jgi:hypothetical protein
MAAARDWFKQALASAGAVDEGRKATKESRAAKQGEGEAANGTSTSNGNGAAAAEGDEQQQLSSLSAHTQVRGAHVRAGLCSRGCVVASKRCCRCCLQAPWMHLVNPPPVSVCRCLCVCRWHQVLHGNALYEWSQVLAAVGDAGWRAVLDEASSLFRAAGCAEKDIRDALKNHTQVGGWAPWWWWWWWRNTLAWGGQGWAHA